jgi:NAD dependent epimerase/dehydratase family enzyme
MADLTIFASQRVVGDRLATSGYTFRHPDVDAALAAVLGDGRGEAGTGEGDA